MLKRYFFTLLALSISLTGFAQVVLPLDFEQPAANYTFEGFEGADSAIETNPDQTGENTSATVMRTTKTDGAAFFAGTVVTLDQPIDFSTNKGISFLSWSPKANIPVRLRLENADNSSGIELDVNTSVANAWETLTYNLESRIDPAVSYTRVVIFYEFINGQAGDGTTYYYDNVQTVDVSGGPVVGLPVDFEDATINYDLLGFEGANASVVMNPDQSGENTSATVVQYDKTDGSAFFAGVTLTLNEDIDFSSDKGISISSWSPKADIPVRIQIEGPDGANTRFVDVNTTVASQWETLVADFSTQLVPGATYNKVVIFYEFIVDLAGDGSTYYYDNVSTADVSGVDPTVVLPVDFELMDVTYNITGFEGAVSSVVTNPDQSGENTSATVVRTEKTDGALFFAGTTLQLDAPIDFSTDKAISISSWSPKADIPVRIQVEGAGDGTAVFVDVNTTVANQWETLTADLSSVLVPGTDYVKVVIFYEFVVDLAGDGSVYYYDNIATAAVDAGPQVGLPVDFESMELTYNFFGFEGADSAIETNPDQSGDNTSATIMRTTKTDGSQWFAGTALDLDVAVDFSTDKGISLSTWSPKADIPVRIQLEDRTTPENTRFVDVNTTVASSWETITADFTGVAVDGAVYDRVTIIFEAVTDLAGDGSTYYYDNVATASIGGGGPEIVLPVTFEDETLNYNPVGFEGADSAVEANPDPSGVNQTETVLRTIKTDGAQFFAGTTIALDQPIDLSNSGMLFIDTWSPKANIPVRVKIENADASVIAELDVNTTTASAWETLMYDFSSAPAADYVKVIVFFEFIPDLAGDGTTYYFDNINVDQAVSVTDLTAEQVQVFPNPTANVWQVNAPDARIEALDLFNMNGQRILTATPGVNQFEIDATNLPTGTYVLRVLTAEGRRITRLVKQ